jgi:hypothetical protein
MKVRDVIKRLEEGGRKIMRYAVVIEKGENSYGAYVPDLPGCVAVGESLASTARIPAPSPNAGSG